MAAVARGNEVLEKLRDPLTTERKDDVAAAAVVVVVVVVEEREDKRRLHRQQTFADSPIGRMVGYCPRPRCLFYILSSLSLLQFGR